MGTGKYKLLIGLLMVVVVCAGMAATFTDIDSPQYYGKASQEKAYAAIDANNANLENGASTAVPWYDTPMNAVPSTHYTYFDDFFYAGYIANARVDTTGTNVSTLVQAGPKFSETANYGEWLVSVTDGDSDEGETILVADDVAGGELQITCNNKTADAVQCQMNGEAFAATLTKDLWYETKIKIEDVSADTVFVGLTVADTDPLGSLGNDFIGFYVDQSTNMTFQMAKNGAITTNATLVVIADDTAVTLGFYADGSASNVYVYVDGALAATHTASASLPNDEALSPAMSILTTGTDADALKVDYLKIIGQR